MESGHTQDVFQVFEQAMQFFEVFSPDAGKSDTADKMRQYFQMMELVKGMAGTQEDTKDTEFEYHSDILHNPAMRGIKSAVSNLGPEYRRSMSMVIRLIELRKLLEEYTLKLIFMQRNKPGDWRKNTLMSIRPFMEKEKQDKIDILINAIDLKETMALLDLMSMFNVAQTAAE
jgi:hypothetical protein